MKPKTMYVVLAVFAVLIIIYIIQNVSSDKKPVSEAFTSLSEGIQRDEITGIEVYYPDAQDSALVLSKEGDSWIVESKYGAPAKETEINRLLDELADLKGELRGDNPDLAADLGLTDTTAAMLVVTGRDGNTLATYLLGNRGPNYRGVFIQRAASNKMYLANTNLRSTFGLYAEDSQPDSKKWIDTKVFPYQKEELDRIKIVSPNKGIELVNAEQPVPEGDTAQVFQSPKKEWKKGEISRGVTVEDKDVNSLVSRVVNLRATDVADPERTDEYGFTSPDYKVELTDPAGDIHTFIVGKQLPDDENSYYAKVLGKDVVYIINKSGFSNLFVTPFEKS